jgi:hypothetical protein
MFGEDTKAPKNWPLHVLLSAPLQPEQIARIGAREGWRAKTFGREPFFHVIEFCGKPADDRGRLAGHGSGIPGVPGGGPEVDDERS